MPYEMKRTDSNARVALERFIGPAHGNTCLEGRTAIEVSTVLLYGRYPEGQYETLVNGDWTYRTNTRRKARQMHARIVRALRRGHFDGGIDYADSAEARWSESMWRAECIWCNPIR